MAVARSPMMYEVTCSTHGGRNVLACPEEESLAQLVALPRLPWLAWG